MIDSFIDSLTIDKVQRHGALEVRFLKSDMASDMDIRTFDDMKDFVEVTEVSDDGEVPFLSFLNKSPYHILVLSGSLITGNFQNRTVKSGFLLKPNHHETRISVFCVENYRWKDKISRGKKSDYHLSADIRKGLKSSQQNEIWRKIREKSGRLGANSPSQDIHAIYEARRNEIEALQRDFKPNAEHIGMITLLQDKVVSLDAFGVKGLYPKLHDSIITSYIVDALDEACCEDVKNRKPLTVDAFLRAIKEAKRAVEQDGQVISFESADVLGDSIVQEKQVIEMEAFAV